jgi:hypothetical protein
LLQEVAGVALRHFIMKPQAAVLVACYQDQHLLPPVSPIRLRLALGGQRQLMDQTQQPFPYLQ